MRHFRSIALVWGLVITAACGGDSDDGDGGGGNAGTGPVTAAPGEVDTGLPESTPLEDVTPEQYANACEALREEVASRLGPDRAVRGVCEVFGGTATDDPTQCRATADACVPQVNDGTFLLPVTREQLDFTQFECGDTGELEGCSVTIGELETCLEDQMSSLEALLDDNDCDNAASVGIAEASALVDLGSTSPPSCARVQDECPGVGPFANLGTP
jgi:hypothetical protein